MLTTNGRRVAGLVVWLLLALIVAPALLAGTPLLVRIIAFAISYGVAVAWLLLLAIDAYDG
jgi:hypothetical protein